jgi:hypothetical protein
MKVIWSDHCPCLKGTWTILLVWRTFLFAETIAMWHRSKKVSHEYIYKNLEDIRSAFFVCLFVYWENSASPPFKVVGIKNISPGKLMMGVGNKERGFMLCLPYG